MEATSSFIETWHCCLNGLHVFP